MWIMLISALSTDFRLSLGVSEASMEKLFLTSDQQARMRGKERDRGREREAVKETRSESGKANKSLSLGGL